jgi:hypothetical protein
MRRRTFLCGGIAGLGAILAGCSSTATAGVTTNDLVLRNTLDERIHLRVELTGDVDLSLVYPLGPGVTDTITDYVSEGPYTLTATATVLSGGEKVDIDDEATAKWDPKRCHDKWIVVHRHDIDIRSAECDTSSTDASDT